MQRPRILKRIEHFVACQHIESRILKAKRKLEQAVSQTTKDDCYKHIYYVLCVYIISICF